MPTPAEPYHLNGWELVNHGKPESIVVEIRGTASNNRICRGAARLMAKAFKIDEPPKLLQSDGGSNQSAI